MYNSRLRFEIIQSWRPLNKIDSVVNLHRTKPGEECSKVIICWQIVDVFLGWINTSHLPFKLSNVHIAVALYQCGVEIEQCLRVEQCYIRFLSMVYIHKQKI